MDYSMLMSVGEGVTLAAVLAVWSALLKFIKEQKKVNELQADSIRSMQRAEIFRAFQRHVEDGVPMSPEELEHLERCYEAYKASGGNGTGTLMYEKVKTHATLVTKVD